MIFSSVVTFARIDAYPKSGSSSGATLVWSRCMSQVFSKVCMRHVTWNYKWCTIDSIVKWVVRIKPKCLPSANTTKWSDLPMANFSKRQCCPKAYLENEKSHRIHSAWETQWKFMKTIPQRATSITLIVASTSNTRDGTITLTHEHVYFYVCDSSKDRSGPKLFWYQISRVKP